MNAHCAQTQTTMHPRGKRRRRPAPLLLSLVAAAPNTLPVRATSNFCGTDWGDASSNCDGRQPCPLGTDEECEYGGTCWGDTTCDTSLGHGKLYDLNHPEHARFCGTSWNDATANCESSRHCPSGDESECPGDEECYSFLSGCNYVEMMGGPLGAAAAAMSGGDGGGGGGGNGNGLPKDDPSRSNYCGMDWNDALANCDEWCPSGSNSECSGGRICFAGTSCKYDDDLFPTVTPTDRPTERPSSSPVVYNKLENTRFCGEGWEDARTTCRIGSHCPSGSNSDCFGSQVCYGWITGCNILDFVDHLRETGQEIFGADHWLLPEGEEGAWAVSSGGVEEDALPSSASVAEPQLPPAEITIPTSPLTPRPPTPSPTTGKPTIHDPNQYNAENHIFCGRTWTDASERCSPETFCANGAATQCASAADYCWVGVSACSAADWVPTASPNTPLPTPRPTPLPTPRPTRLPTRRPTHLPTRRPTPSPTPKPVQTKDLTSRPLSSPPLTSPQDFTPEVAEEEPEITTTTIRQSYCATNYNHLKRDCAKLSTCNRYKPCPDDYMCFANYKCTITVVSKPKPGPAAAAPISRAPISNAPISNAPVTRPPTHHPTIFTLTNDEVAQRLTNMNNYCATSLSQVLSSCAHSLYTCNVGDGMCGMGTFCFESIVCPDADAIADKPAPLPTPLPSPEPIDINPISNLGSGGGSMTSISTMTQNYCARNEEHLRATCSTAPTCNDGDEPCPSGTFCFGKRVCNDSSVMAVPKTKPATSKPSSKPSSKPISLSDVSNMLSNSPPIGNDGNFAVVVMPQNYCAMSEDDLQSNCAEAQTCNDGDGPCPKHTFCFGNYSCSSNHSAKAPIPVSQNKPSSASDGNTEAAAAANYCAQSADQLEATCAWAPTCNDSDGPCPTDTFCFPNVVCDSLTLAAAAKATQPPTVMPTSPYVHDGAAAATATSIDLACDDLCLLPIDSSQCNYIMSIENDISPCTAGGDAAAQDIEIGDLCTGTGRCGTATELNNCRSDNNNQDIYVRLPSSECVKHGLVDGRGVIPPARTDADAVNSTYEGDDIDHLANMTTKPTGNNQGDVGGEDSASDDGNFGHDNGDQNPDHPSNRWWIMENNSTTRTIIVGWKKYSISALKALVVALTFLDWL